jgi:hypothetical protein
LLFVIVIAPPLEDVLRFLGSALQDEMGARSGNQGAASYEEIFV